MAAADPSSLASQIARALASPGRPDCVSTNNRHIFESVPTTVRIIKTKAWVPEIVSGKSGMKWLGKSVLLRHLSLFAS
jgi:hypothetical protein